MAVSLRTSVTKEINRLRKTIVRSISDLASLKDELKRHERVYELLSGGRAGKRGIRRRARRSVTVDWNSVLEGLPATFTIDNVLTLCPHALSKV